MRVVHACHGKFHHQELARQLHARGILERFFTGYPRWKLKREDLPQQKISTFPWVETPYMALLKMRLMGGRLHRQMHRLLVTSFDRYTASRIPDCDVFIGLSGSGLNAGRTVQTRGGLYVCDRASSHIVAQDRLLREEYERHGQTFAGIDPWVIEREQAEYDQADLVTVPSEFVRQTFLKQSVPSSKIVKVPYGVNLQHFSKICEVPTESFEVVFVGRVSLRKGIPDLLQAFNALDHPRKRLTIVGGITDETRSWLATHSIPDKVSFAGHCQQSRLTEILSRSHVMVLPSIEEGMAYVMAQSLACGCPVVASEHTGARDLFEDGDQGFIVPIRSPSVIAERLQLLADEPDLRQRMGESALRLVREALGGWNTYGDRMVEVLSSLVSGERGQMHGEGSDARYSI